MTFPRFSRPVSRVEHLDLESKPFELRTKFESTCGGEERRRKRRIGRVGTHCIACFFLLSSLAVIFGMNIMSVCFSTFYGGLMWNGKGFRVLIHILRWSDVECAQDGIRGKSGSRLAWYPPLTSCFHKTEFLFKKSSVADLIVPNFETKAASL